MAFRGTDVSVDLAVGQKIRAFRRQQEMVDPDPVVPVIGAALESPRNDSVRGHVSGPGRHP